MKRNIFSIIVVALTSLMVFTSCDDILDRPSKTTKEDDNYWDSEAKLRLYANGFYD